MQRRSRKASTTSWQQAAPRNRQRQLAAAELQDRAGRAAHSALLRLAWGVMLVAAGSSSTARSSEETPGGAHTLWALLTASAKFSSCSEGRAGQGRAGQGRAGQAGGCAGRQGLQEGCSCRLGTSERLNSKPALRRGGTINSVPPLLDCVLYWTARQRPPCPPASAHCVLYWTARQRPPCPRARQRTPRAGCRRCGAAMTSDYL